MDLIVFVENHAAMDGVFHCLNSVGKDRKLEPIVDDAVIGKAGNYLFKVICEADKMKPSI